MRQAEDSGWRTAPPASAAAITELAKHAAVPLPDEYLAFFAESNGGEGELGAQPGWFVMWRAEDVLELNRSYEVATHIPGFLGFGSNGGGELLAFDTRAGQPYPVVAVPFVPMEVAEARAVAPSFSGFRTLLGIAWDEGATA